MGKLVLIACCAFIVWLFRKDVAWRQAGRRALWIPGFWLLVQGSCPVSYWFGRGGGDATSPIDTLVFGGLIGAAIVVLLKEGFRWGEFAARNKALILIYAFFLCSMAWSELPAISGKRLFKDFGCVLVGSVFLVQKDPALAIRAVFTRVSYVLFPLSVVVIRYFPDIGRQANRAGENMFTGLTTHKNSLGLVVFVFGIILLWDLVETWNEPDRKGRKEQLAIRALMLLMGLWLLHTCDSQTSLLCLIIGTGVFWTLGRLVGMRNGKAFLTLGLILVILLVFMDNALGITDAIIQALGRDPSLTGRTAVWGLVLDQETDHFLGSGFYTFWSTDMGLAVIEQYFEINSAHNGYLEVYLDGGIVGDGFLVMLLLVTGWRAINRVFEGHPLGRVGLIFWLLAIIYNFSESSFFRLDVLWFSFLLTSVHPPRLAQRIAERPAPIHALPA